MNKLITITTLVSLAYFGILKYETSHPITLMDFVVIVLSTMIFGAWMIAAIVVADELGKRDVEDISEKSC